MKSTFKILNRFIGDGYPTYFIADIGANHEGDLHRAQSLIFLAAEAGADAAKFQNFTAPKIVSEKGFRDLGAQKSHQSGWKKSVYKVYEAASLPWKWTETLKQCCDSVGIHYFSSPYDYGAVDMLEAFVPAYKIGSGDITWIDIIGHIARKRKPVILATGASDLLDVQRAMTAIQKHNDKIVLMQCNTNYTGLGENFNYINLNVLKTYARLFPGVVLGLSDHTPGHATVLGAIVLGARVIEKHFTDDTSREGPDHGFAMDPRTWKEMVQRARELELALGGEIKRVEANERETVILQRRCVRASRDLPAGTRLASDDLECLRPCANGGIQPYALSEVIGKVLQKDLRRGEHLTFNDI